MEFFQLSSVEKPFPIEDTAHFFFISEKLSSVAICTYEPIFCYCLLINETKMMKEKGGYYLHENIVQGCWLQHDVIISLVLMMEAQQPVLVFSVHGHQSPGPPLRMTISVSHSLIPIAWTYLMGCTIPPMGKHLSSHSKQHAGKATDGGHQFLTHAAEEQIQKCFSDSLPIYFQDYVLHFALKNIPGEWCNWLSRSCLIIVIFYSSLIFLGFFTSEFMGTLFKKHWQDPQFKCLNDTDF